MRFLEMAGRRGQWPWLLMGVILFGGCASAGDSAQAVRILVRTAHDDYRKGDFPGAEKADLAAIAINGKDPSLYNNLAVVEDREGQRQKALESLEKGERVAPEDAAILMNLARLDLESGRDAEALAVASRIEDLATWPNGLRTLIGKIEIDLGRYPEAHLLLHEAFERHPSNTLILTYIGIVHLREGQESLAREAFGKALRMDPSPGLRRSLQRLMRAAHGLAGPVEHPPSTLPGGGLLPSKKG